MLSQEVEEAAEVAANGTFGAATPVPTEPTDCVRRASSMNDTYVPAMPVKRQPQNSAKNGNVDPTFSHQDTEVGKIGPRHIKDLPLNVEVSDE